MSDFVPVRFGKYQLIEKIATGGMAEVYKAKSYGVAGFEKLLCIKKILPHLSGNAEFVKMFINEAKIAVSLNHANIVQVYDLGKVNDEYYMAMEFIHGQDLMTVIKVGRQTRRFLPIPTGVHIITEAARGLDYAHSLTDPAGRPLNVVHQDVSPHNLMISYEGDVKLMDFGIARVDSGEDTHDEKVGGGKFAYMSPEQARGIGADRRSDIFALGIILYEVITGQRLYAGKDRKEKMRMVRNAEIPPPRAVNPEIPPRLEEILLRSLAFDPDERYQEARDLQEDLLSFLYDVGMRVTRADLAAFQKEIFAEEYRRANAGAVVNAIFSDLNALEAQPDEDLAAESQELKVSPTGEWDHLEDGGDASQTAGSQSSVSAELNVEFTQGERRQVEVLAVEVTGLTDLSTRLGEEALLRLNFAFLKSVAALVRRFHGEITRFDSDRMLIFWGLTRSTSKDLELCLRCAMDLRRLSEKFAQARGEAVHLSMGVHRGPVLVAPETKRRKRRDSYTPWGDTVKLARRLCEAAPLDEVLISEKVFSWVSERGEAEVLDPLPVKWAAHRITPYRLLRMKNRGERGRAGRWVKRAGEFDVLKEAIAAAAAGQTTVFLIEGDAGSGKARFVREIREITRDREIAFYTGRGYFYRREVPFLPFREILEQVCGFEDGDTPDERREKLIRLSELRLDPIDVHILGQLFEVEFPESNLKYLSGDQMRMGTFDAFRKILVGLTDQSFAILALENLQYLDPYSRELLGHLARTLPSRRLLLVVTAPPDARLDLDAAAPVMRHELPPLGRAEMEVLAQDLLGVIEVPPLLLDLLEASSGGNALFAKEILGQLRRDGMLRLNEGVVELKGELTRIEVPPTVADLVASRIDALSPTERVVLEVAATVGRSFERAILLEVTRLADEELAEILGRLVSIGLVRPVRPDDQADGSDYVFRHNVSWEVAQRGIVAGRAKEFNVRVAEAIERLKADNLRPHYERLSRHYQAGGLLPRASRFAEQAGAAYEQAWYSREAQRCYQRAILLLRGSDSEDRGVASHLAELYLKIGAVEVRELRFDEARRSFHHALEFAAESEDDLMSARVMVELGRLLSEQHEVAEAGRYLKEAQELAADLGDEGLLADADEEMSKWALAQGEFASAKVALNRALAAARGRDDKVRIARILGTLGSYYARAGQYPLSERHLVQARDLAMQTGDKILQGKLLNNLGVTFIHMERYPEALDCYRQACEIRKGIEYRRGVIINLHNIGDVYFRMGDYARAYQYFEQSQQAAQENDWEQAVAMNMVYLGFLRALRGEEQEGEAALRTGIERCVTAGDQETAAQGRVFLARILSRRGATDEARAILASNEGPVIDLLAGL